MVGRQLRSQRVAGSRGSRGGWGSAPNPIQGDLGGIWGRAPAGVSGRSPQLHSCGETAPGFGAEPQMIQSSQPVWSRREEPSLSESSLAGALGGLA
ncbi:MAG: hypothetical protein GY696_14315 [Gammaproteobacteria bacterium]|nr:hypothetical protein [Gammaproteobacteria bacterium]